MLIEFGLQSKPVYICSVLSAFVHKLSSMYFSHRHTHISLEAEIHFNVEICVCVCVCELSVVKIINSGRTIFFA